LTKEEEMPIESSVRKGILEILSKLTPGTDIALRKIAERLKRDTGSVSKQLKDMGRLGVVVFTTKLGCGERKVRLARKGTGEELLSFVETCLKFGLAGEDIKILESGAEEADEVNQKTGILLNVAQMHIGNIKRIAGTKTLAAAKKKIFGKRKIPALISSKAGFLFA
jgi:hypothetical protein